VATVLRTGAFSTPEIEKILGGKHHSTILYYLKAHTKLLGGDVYSSMVVEAERIRRNLDERLESVAEDR
jgi:chromosomal replication initiation ATPase DnaA